MQSRKESKYTLIFHPAFRDEFRELSEVVQTRMMASAEKLRQFGPGLGRPHVDTLNGSKHPNMKELRFNADNGVWRVAAAFDRQRKIIMLVAGNKSGISDRLFYKRLGKKADTRFDEHLEKMEKGGNHESDRKK